MAGRTTKATAKATPKKDRHNIFLAALAQYGNVTQSAGLAGLDRAALYAKRGKDAAFAAAWDEALSIGVAALEDEARRRAYEGWDETVFHEGQACGVKRRYSDTLLIVLLKAHMPDKYAERRRDEISGPGGGPLTINVVRFGQDDDQEVGGT